MGFLEDLQKKLSTPGADHFSEERFRKAKPRVYSELPETQTVDKIPPVMFDMEKEARRKRRRFYLILGIAVAVLAVASATLIGIRVFNDLRSVKPGAIGITIDHPATATSGDTVKYEIALKNSSRVRWQNVAVEAILPEGFEPKESIPAAVSGTGTARWGAGTLDPGQTVSFKLFGRLLGEEGDSPRLSVTATLNPESAPVRTEKKTEYASVVIDTVPLDLAVTAPRQAANGEKIKLDIAYRNRTQNDLNDVRVVLYPPVPGFSFLSSGTEPTASDKETGTLTWDLKTVAQQTNAIIAIEGTMSGDPDASRQFRAEIGFLDEKGKMIAQKKVAAITVIARRALSVNQYVKEAQDSLRVDPGEELKGRVVVKNTGDIGLRNVIVKMTLGGKALNAKTVKAPGGFYSSQSGTITWSAGSVPGLSALRSQGQVELPFEFQVIRREDIPYSTEADRNFNITAVSVADSPDLPTPPGAAKEVSSGTFEILLNSVLGIKTDAFYDDGRAGLPISTGPKTPTVGQETVYTVRARITNTTNEIIDGTYRVTLPEGVRWLNNKYTTAGEAQYTERNRELVWRLGVIAPRAGTAFPGPEFAFQVGITPSLNQLGSAPMLAKGSVMEGRDAYTGAQIRAVAEPVTTESVDARNYEVVR